jgi:hypothetical protein
MIYVRCLAITLALTYAGCAAQIAPATSPITSPAKAAHRSHLDSNMLIFATDSGELRYWPISQHGGRTSYLLAKLTNVNGPSAMASHGDTIALGVGTPSSIVLYNAASGQQTSLGELHGYPLDIAYDTAGNIIVLNVIDDHHRDIIVYEPPQFAPTTLSSCAFIDYNSSYVAADNEGNIYINQNIPESATVIEIPKNPSGYAPERCSKLPISETGSAAGLLVDAKTDNLVVFHEPDLCAGGNEAEMNVYGKPYGRGTKMSKNLHGNCADTLRFGLDDTQVYFLDGSPELRTRNSGPNDYGEHVDQRNYPGGGGRGVYRDSRLATGVATIP